MSNSFTNFLSMYTTYDKILFIFLTISKNVPSKYSKCKIKTVTPNIDFR